MGLESAIIGIAGDVMIGRLVDDVLNKAPSEYIWGNVLPILRKTAMNLINLEAALTTSDEIVPKVFNFKSHPSHVQSLKEASIHVVNLANNHVLDYSEKGLLETLQTLDEAGIAHAGAGKNINEAKKPVITTCKGIRIGVLGYTDNEPTWEATETKPGICYIEAGDEENIIPEIQKLRPQVDLLILSLHWGPNMRHVPTKQFVQFAHKLIDGGVDVVHGHSAHIFQGIERYQDGLILYDTGDFVDDYYVDPDLRNDQSFLFLLEVDKEGIRELRMIPTIIRNFQVTLAAGMEADSIISRMQHLSRANKTEVSKNEGQAVFKFDKG